MTHYKRNFENTLCMKYLPRVKEYTEKIRLTTCRACVKQIPSFLEAKIEELESQTELYRKDLDWWYMWHGEGNDDLQP